MNKNKGFTIIELIVVIAIIAVLAAIVLVNVTQYIAKGKDASIKGNMASIATIAAAYYDNNTSSYTGLGSDAAYAAGIVAIDDANGSGTVTDEIISGAYCVESTLNAGGSWCVDSTGYKGSTAECDATTADCAADA
jgi:Tfp pilus assembly protein PilE